MDAIDKLLSQIKADDRTTAKIPKAAPLQSSDDIDNLLAEVQTNYAVPATAKSLENDSPAINNILSQVKANYDQQDRERLQLKQQQLQAEQLKQIETLKTGAKAWLKQLDPLSTEGLWFEKFAEGYSSKLEAAINYLQES